MKLVIKVFISIVLLQCCLGILHEYVPDCARPGVHYGAGVGAIAGGMTGAAAFTGTSLGGATLAMCPTMSLASLTGAGGAFFGSPLMPVGGLIFGALFGGLAGGSTGGWIQCRRDQQEETQRAIEFYIRNHPEGTILDDLRKSTSNYFKLKKPNQATKTIRYYYKDPIIRPPTPYYQSYRFPTKANYIQPEVKVRDEMEDQDESKTEKPEENDVVEDFNKVLSLIRTMDKMTTEKDMIEDQTESNVNAIVDETANDISNVNQLTPSSDEEVAKTLTAPRRMFSNFRKSQNEVRRLPLDKLKRPFLVPYYGYNLLDSYQDNFYNEPWYRQPYSHKYIYYNRKQRHPFDPEYK